MFSFTESLLCLVLALPLGLGCSEVPTGPDPEKEGDDDDGPPDLDDECGQDSDCEAGDLCVRGVCDSFGRTCAGDCGRHFECLQGFCQARSCDLPCCSFFDCGVTEVCEDFECRPASCDGSPTSCDVEFAELIQFVCVNARCPGDALCLDFEPPFARICVEPADATCANLPGFPVLVFADGVAETVCGYRGQCVSGECQP